MGAGRGFIATSSRVFERYLRVHAADHFIMQGEVTVSNIYTACISSFGMDVTIEGSAVADGSIVAEGHFLSISGHFSSGRADQYSGLVPELDGTPLTLANNFLAKCRDLAIEAIQIGNDTHTYTIIPEFYASERPGNNDIMFAAGFSFRTTDQCAAGDFKFYETRWQQMARLWSSSVQVWTESFVAKESVNTAPFPGVTRLTESAFCTQDLSLFDLAEGVSKDRSDSGYEDPAYATQANSVLNSSYTTINPFAP